MAQAQYEIGALAVIQDVSEQHEINRALKRIDERLFVEKQLTFMDEQTWCVVEDTGEAFGAERYVCVYEFRDAQGRPIPYLTMAIVEEMQHRAQAGTGNVTEARKISRRRAEQRKERMRLEAEGQYRAIAEDFERHRVIGNFQIIPRSVALARSRARARSARAEQLSTLAEARRISRALARRGAIDRLRAA